MRTLILLTTIMTTQIISAQHTTDIEKNIINLEKMALERWNNGDIYGYLDLTSEDVTYFDPMLEKRMDGLDNLTTYYKPLQGKVFGTFEMLNPRVQVAKDMAVLTYNLNANNKNTMYLWNCTEVFRKEKNGTWKIIHSHWSFTKPE